MPGNLTEESRVGKHQEGAVEIDIEKFRQSVTLFLFCIFFSFPLFFFFGLCIKTENYESLQAQCFH